MSSDTCRKLEKQLRAFELRCERKSYREIAKELQVSPSTANCYVREYLIAHNQKLAEKAEDVRVQELEHIDRLERALLPAADAGDIAAQRMILRWKDQRAKYQGLYADESIDVRVVVPEQTEELDYARLTEDEILQLKALQDKARGKG